MGVEVSKSSARDRNSISRMVQPLDHLQPVGQSPGEPVDVGDHQGVPFEHQVQQFQEAAAVVLGPAGLLGSNIAHGAAGADQPLHLQVQILVLRLSDRDPGIAVQRHLGSHPWLEYLKYGFLPSGFANGFSSHHLSYGEWGFTAMAVNRAVYSHPPSKNRHFERSAVRHGPEPCCRRRGACRVIATDPLRGRHGRLRYVNPQEDLRGLALGALAVRRGIRRGWQHQTVTEVAGEGCREAWPYTAHESHAGVGGMTECGLILLLPNHSRTLQLIPQTAGNPVPRRRVPCVTCRNPESQYSWFST